MTYGFGNRHSIQLSYGRVGADSSLSEPAFPLEEQERPDGRDQHHAHGRPEPPGLVQPGHFREILLKMAPITEGGSRNTVTTEKILRMLFWSMLMRPSVASRMNDTLVPRNEAWSLIAMTSRVRVRNRARTSCDIGHGGALLDEGRAGAPG